MSSSAELRLRPHGSLGLVALAATTLACSELGTDPAARSGSESPSVTRSEQVTGVGAPVAHGRHHGRPTSSSRPSCWSPSAPGPGPYLTATFSNPRWELTAANGDELWLEAPEAVAVISLDDNSLRAVGTHTIIGGTGRFEDAAGELVSGAVNEDGMGPDDFRSDGRIRY